MEAVRKSSISRRRLLRGTGVALGLPWLEAMGAASSSGRANRWPVRMAALYMPNGA